VNTQDQAGSSPAAAAIRLALAHQAAQALYVATRLGVPDLLGNGATLARDVACQTGTQPYMMQRLLRALSAFGVVIDRGTGEFRLTPIGEYLQADHPQSARALVLMYGSEHAREAFAGLEDCVRTGKNVFQLHFGAANSFDYLGGRPELAQVFNEGMSAASAIAGPAVVGAFDFSRVRHIVDVGAGQGALLAQILQAHPHLRGTHFDLPRVTDGASAFLATKGISGRYDVVGGDMFEGVPNGGDLYLLSHVIHNWNDAQAIRILRSCRRAMSPKGHILIFDRIMPERVELNAYAQGCVLMDLTMLVRTGGGQERSAREFDALLAAADLRLERIIPTSNTESLVEAALNNVGQ
jgi:SAM-dependent methyltransferase